MTWVPCHRRDGRLTPTGTGACRPRRCGAGPPAARPDSSFLLRLRLVVFVVVLVGSGRWVGFIHRRGAARPTSVHATDDSLFHEAAARARAARRGAPTSASAWRLRAVDADALLSTAGANRRRRITPLAKKTKQNKKPTGHRRELFYK